MNPSVRNFLAAVAVLLAVSGCGGGVGPATYGLGGTVTGLAEGRQVVLLSGAGSQATIRVNGNFAFPDKLPAGAKYALTVQQQPLGQTCTVANASNASDTAGVKNDVTNVTISCVDNPLALGGTLAGLPPGSSITISNGASSSVRLSSNGPYTLPFKLATATPYSVTVTEQPVGATCTVSNSSGTTGTASLSNINVQCARASLAIGGDLAGLSTGQQVQLKVASAGEDASAVASTLTLAVNGPFTFASSIPFGAGYAITVAAQPDGQTCSVSNASSSAVTAAVRNVQVVCSANRYPLVVTVMGLASLPGGQALTLKNGAESLAVRVNGTYQFPGPVAHGGSYSVTVGAQPSGQTCTLSNSSVQAATATSGPVSVQCLSFVWRSRLIAGSGTAGGRDDTAAMASFFGPSGISATPQGNLVVADNSSSRIRQITMPSAAVSTIAGFELPGYVDSPSPLAASFSGPVGVAVDSAGNIFVADSGNHVIRRIAAGTRAVTTWAGSGVAGFQDGTGTAAQFNSPRGLAIDRDGNLYVADTGNHVVRKISATSRAVTLLAGMSGRRGLADGPAASAMFNGPAGIAVNAQGTVYVADTQNSAIRAISVAGQVATVAGGTTSGLQDGAGPAASFSLPAGVAVEGLSTLYVADTGNHAVRQIQLVGTVGTVLTIAGSGRAAYADGAGVASEFDQPLGIALDASGNLVITEAGGQRVRSVFRAMN